jgi:excisionase family DNA binding protein
MITNPISFDAMPSVLSQLLAKVEGIERRMDAASAPPPQQPDYVTLQEALKILRHTVVSGTIYNWKHQGRIASTKVGRKLLFKRSDVEAMLRGNYTPTAAEQSAQIEEAASELLCQSIKRKNGRL